MRWTVIESYAFTPPLSIATEFPRKVAKVLSHQIEGTGWNFCTVAFRQQAVWRGRRSLPSPPRVGVVKPDKRRRATLGGGDMPKAIRAHLLLFPRTREHLKPTLTPPSQIEPLPRGCCTDTPTWLCREPTAFSTHNNDCEFDLRAILATERSGSGPHSPEHCLKAGLDGCTQG